MFGEGLNPLEQEWLAAVINEHLGGLVHRRLGHLAAHRARWARAWHELGRNCELLFVVAATERTAVLLQPTHPAAAPTHCPPGHPLYADENRGRARELEGFVDAGPAALPESSSSASGGRRFSDFVSPAQQQAAAAEQAAQAAGWQAQQAGERAAAAARRAGERAAADVERSAGRFRGSAWRGKQQQRQQFDDDDDDVTWNV